MKRIYNEIANRYDTTPTEVEREITYALDLAKQSLVELHFNSATMNRFTNMANKSVDEILETLRKANEKAGIMGM